MQEDPDPIKPKSILKTSGSFDTANTASYRKSAKFDELNLLKTYHPPDKDYGHMQIDEPKTPYNYVNSNLIPTEQLDANLLAEKLRVAASIRASVTTLNDEIEDTEEKQLRRLEFERRRKEHYKEFHAIKSVRKLIEEELAAIDDDPEEVVGDVTNTSNLESEGPISHEPRSESANISEEARGSTETIENNSSQATAPEMEGAIGFAPPHYFSK